MFVSVLGGSGDRGRAATRAQWHRRRRWSATTSSRALGPHRAPESVLTDVGGWLNAFQTDTVMGARVRCSPSLWTAGCRWPRVSGTGSGSAPSALPSASPPQRFMASGYRRILDTSNSTSDDGLLRLPTERRPTTRHPDAVNDPSSVFARQRLRDRRDDQLAAITDQGYVNGALSVSRRRPTHAGRRRHAPILQGRRHVMRNRRARSPASASTAAP